MLTLIEVTIQLRCRYTTHGIVMNVFHPIYVGSIVVQHMVLVLVLTLYSLSVKQQVMVLLTPHRSQMRDQTLNS